MDTATSVQKTLIANRAPIGGSAKDHKGENMCNNATMIISSQM
jgi:isocitrate/isopropylmalate dehydrogenase